jgi:hypothetical protein
VNRITIRFTATDCDWADDAVERMQEQLSMSVADTLLAWLDELPKRYLKEIEAAGLQLVKYTSPFRDWFVAPERLRTDKPPPDVSDDIGVFEFVSEEEADRAVALLGLRPI